MRRRLLFSILCVVALSLPSVARAMEPEVLSVLRVQPLLKEKCLGCHGDDKTKLKGDYDMTTPLGVMRGGESGQEAVVPGKPEKSPMYLSVMRDHDDWSAMPPKDNDALTPEQRGWIRAWIAGGAPWPDEKRRKEIQSESEKWLRADGVTVKVTGALSQDWANRRYKPEDLWAYQPIKSGAGAGRVINRAAKPDKGGTALRSPTKEEPRSTEEGEKVGLGNEIDRLIALKMPEGLEVAPRADAATLMRRLSFTLTGLPPSGIGSAFDSKLKIDPKAVMAQEIDRLMKLPQYGEHMARHWLDVVRYADSAGFANDYERGNAWRYRDYVVRAFNERKPYDRFVREQIAGDEIAEQEHATGDAASELLIAAGFLRLGPWELTSMEVPKVARQRFLDDVTNATGVTFLGQAMDCCRCHDHKFDPLPTHDYYAMQAVFATTQFAERPAPFTAAENVTGFEEARYLKKKQEVHQTILEKLDTQQIEGARHWYAEKKLDAAPFEKALEKAGGYNKKKNRVTSRYDGARAAMLKQGVPEDQIPPRHFGFTAQDHGMERVARKGLERVAWELERYEPIAFSVYNGKTPAVTAVTSPLRMPDDPMASGELEQTAILTGGSPFAASAAVKPAALSVVSAFNGELTASLPDAVSGRRLALAKWITDKRNPLTARVMANRVWMWHFGQPLAGNPNNFGGTGKKPTHPELLDFLAAYLMEHDWSIQALQELILTSETWQRSTKHPAPEVLKEKDPLGTSYAAFTPRRLRSEELRDAALFVSGELNKTLGGIPVRPEINQEAALQPRQVMGTFASAWVPNPKPEQRHRRSIYVLKLRGLANPFMEVFNEPGPDFSCERRDASTVTPQVFSLFNSQDSAHRALALANRVQTYPMAQVDNTFKTTNKRLNPSEAIHRVFLVVFNREPSPEESAQCLAHWEKMTAKHQVSAAVKAKYPTEVLREAVEENTGEKFSFIEDLPANRDLISDLEAGDVDASTRGLADVCLVLLNSNEFVYVY